MPGVTQMQDGTICRVKTIKLLIRTCLKCKVPHFSGRSCDKYPSCERQKAPENIKTVIQAFCTVRYIRPFKSLGSSRQFRVFHENSLLFIK